ncbi:MAG: hypothetical protein K6F32_06060 [Bacilli bacterium]|nr:hypothetical protein [Bacilli bacterium]
MKISSVLSIMGLTALSSALLASVSLSGHENEAEATGSTLVLERVGTEPTAFTVSDTDEDGDGDTFVLNNSNFGTGFIMTDLSVAYSDAVNVEATVSGTAGKDANGALGFTFYYDADNYLIFYFAWDGTTDTIAQACYLPRVGGENTSVCAWARDPWDSYTTNSDNGGFISNWSDYGGFITDYSSPSGHTINAIRSESAITISSGFTYGFTRTRGSYTDTSSVTRDVDIFQMRVTTAEHTWYSATMCIDAYTNPKGGEDSSLKTSSPQIGFYNNSVGAVTYTNVKVSGSSVDLAYSTREKARVFVDTYLHFDDVSTDDESDGTACQGYYATLESPWNNLDQAVRTLIIEDGEFYEAGRRMRAWAAANNASINGSTYVLAKDAQGLFWTPNGILEQGNGTAIVITIAAVIVAATSLFLVSRKRKHN